MFLMKFMYMNYVLDFPCWALGSFLFVYMCRKIAIVAVRFVDAWGLCIDGEWIQGVESSIFEDVVLFLWSLYVFSALIM